MIEKKVLFVKSGFSADPYRSLESSITYHLQNFLDDLIIALPDQDLVALCKTYSPDLVLAFTGLNISPAQLQAIRRLQFLSPKKIILAAWFVDDPYWTDVTARLAPLFDVVFTIETGCVSFYKTIGCKRVYFLPLAVDPNFFYPKNVNVSYQTDILFVGTAFPNRILFFNQLTDYLLRKNFLISGMGWDRLHGYTQLKDKIRLNEWMSPEETANYYNGAKIVINLHRAQGDERFNRNSRKLPAHSVNVRTFEISACSTLQLTDQREDLPLFYTPNHDLITYASPQELIEKAEFYLQHEQERRKLAKQGFNQTQSTHTYHKRLSQLLSMVSQNEG
jgi:spore maturation protein CgeB